MKTKIFISHASPSENDFTKWLALKLIALGYDIWCDLLFLEKGIDFWKIIEKEIRVNTVKFLVVVSESSNKKEGVLNELATANKVKRELCDDTFIIPLIIDENLRNDDLNIELVRLSNIDFRKSWAKGLQDLIESLEKTKVPKKSPDPSKSNQLYQQIFLHNKKKIEREEIYDSNWFSIISFPSELRFHYFENLMPKNYDIRQLSFPAIRYKQYVCTFAWEYDFMEQLPKTELYNNKYSIKMSVEDVLSGQYNTEFINNLECQRLIVQLVNKAFENTMHESKLQIYQMSNKFGYWFPKGELDKDKYNKIQLVGKQRDKNWHFGISGAGKLYPFPVLMISSHIFFTEDGRKLIESKSIQHSARRKQGKNWWNDDWRNKINAFIKYLANNEDSFSLEVGSEEKIIISSASVEFISEVTYNIPEKNTLLDEVELADLNMLDYAEDDLSS
ncbi:toll/interleukin-1 receptor domain-containing protein [Arcicella sp. DC2W]|uniref:Toll/interleukin-1 receptor domain-containing protein n=1 Tax=Arcicella gelida TaxID=2984195 RepID=A0ABU5SAU5_9BACT|nr:toll/interleukin-1 receptor domain-containing protein [Arcicella sp. DC2W]MEA5405610.1 toll/interleukin-1 receptor domain-containing protein [Arcicella sp. DC2W]